MTPEHTAELNAICLDMETCNLGIAFLKGKARKPHVKHLDACKARMAEILALYPSDANDMSDDELLAALEA